MASGDPDKYLRLTKSEPLGVEWASAFSEGGQPLEGASAKGGCRR